MSKADDKFPILSSYRRLFPFDYVRWSALNPNRAERNHSQTLERLAERGGLSPKEIYANIMNADYYDIANVSEEVVLAAIKEIGITASGESEFIKTKKELEQANAHIQQLEAEKARLEALIDKGGLVPIKDSFMFKSIKAGNVNKRGVRAYKVKRDEDKCPHCGHDEVAQFNSPSQTIISCCKCDGFITGG